MIQLQSLQVYNLDSFKMEYISKYASPILSLATSSQGGHLVVGLSDGSWSLRSRKLQKDAPEGICFSDYSQAL